MIATLNRATEGGNLRRCALRDRRRVECSRAHRRVWRTAHAARNSRLGLATLERLLASGLGRSKPANGIRKMASFTVESWCADTEAQGGGGPSPEIDRMNRFLRQGGYQLSDPTDSGNPSPALAENFVTRRTPAGFRYDFSDPLIVEGSAGGSGDAVRALGGAGFVLRAAGGAAGVAAYSLTGYANGMTAAGYATNISGTLSASASLSTLSTVLKYGGGAATLGAGGLQFYQGAVHHDPMAKLFGTMKVASVAAMPFCPPVAGVVGAATFATELIYRWQ